MTTTQDPLAKRLMAACRRDSLTQEDRAAIGAAIARITAGAAPAAVAPQGEYPPLPPALAYANRESLNGMQNMDFAEVEPLPSEHRSAGLYDAAQMRAYFDLGRQPAAVAGPAASVAQIDHVIGMAWWNNASEAERARWSAAAGNTGVPADAYVAFLRDSAPAPAVPEVPAGFALAPKKPSIDMLYAMAECDGFKRGDRDHPGLTHWEDYWHMALAAAPQAPAAPLGMVHVLPTVIRKLIEELDKASPGNTTTAKAEDYLKLHALRMQALGTATAATAELSQAERDVLAERHRQVNAEGFSHARDDQYVGGQLAGAAASYLILAAGGREDEARAFWPWRQEWLKPSSQRRYLEKVGALVLAEMERLDRAAAQAEKGCAAC